MKQIESFQVNHINLKPGLYLSRKDWKNGQAVTTFDLRFTAPNVEPVMDTPAIHTLEHLGATWLRDTDQDGDVVYFGPMGCRTGFYLVLFGDLKPEDVLEKVKAMCQFILNFEGEIPGASPEQCGNWSEQNLNMAKYYAGRYLNELETAGRTVYPQ